MHIRNLVQRTWQERNFYASRNARLRAFLADQDEHPERPLEDVLASIRMDYPDLFESLVSPLFETQDKLLRVTLIRNADVNSPKDLRLLKAFIRAADPTEDEPELLAMAHLGHRGLTAELRKREPLPASVHTALTAEPLPARSSADKPVVSLDALGASNVNVEVEPPARAPQSVRRRRSKR